MASTAETDFPLVGEPVALDLVNTRAHVHGGDVDLLDSPAALRSWVAIQEDRVPQPAGPLDDADLAAVRALRDHVRDAVQDARRERRPSMRTLRALTDAQRAAPAYRELRWSRGRATAMTRRDGDYKARLCAELADATTELLASPAVTTVRQCEGPECVLLFLPAHPRRRWCSPALCGNRVRVARYYRRHRQA